MLNLVNGSDRVSHEPIKEGSEVSKDNLPKAAPRKINDGDGESRSEDSSDHFDGLEDKEQERPSAKVSNNDEEEHIYTEVDRKKKSPKKSSDSGMPPTPPRRSDSVGSEGSEYSTPLKSSEDTMRGLTKKGTFSCSSRTPSTTDGSEEPLIPDNGSRGSVSITGKNRFWPRVEHVVKKKEFVIPTVSATTITIFLAAYSAYAYLQDHAKFIAFIESNPKFLTVPSAIAFSLFIIGMACAVSQFKNTREFQIQEKDTNKILDQVLECQKDKIIKSVELKYNNGRYKGDIHSIFAFTILKSEDSFIKLDDSIVKYEGKFVNLDEQVNNKISRIGAVINGRPLPVMLLTGVIVANLIIPSALYTIGGINAVQNFYQNILANNIGLSVVIGSAILAVSALFFVVHYYDQTNCNNRSYVRTDLNDAKGINKELLGMVALKEEIALKQILSNYGTCCSSEVKEVIVETYNSGRDIYTIG